MLFGDKLKNAAIARSASSKASLICGAWKIDDQPSEHQK